MSRTCERGLVAILAAKIQDEGASGVPKGHDIAEAEKQIAVAEVRARGGKRIGSRKRIGAVDVDVGVVHLLGDMVIAQNLIKFGEQANLAVGGRLVVRFLVVDKKLWGIGGRDEIQLAIFVDAFGGAEPEGFVANPGAAAGDVVVPAQKIRDIGLTRDVGTVEGTVAVVGGDQAVSIVGAGLGDDVDDATRCMAELGLVSGSDDLELRDRVLIELRRRAAAQFVLIGKTINQEPGVVGALTQDRRGVVAIEIGLAVDGHAGDQLHQVQIIPPVDGHVHNLAGNDGCAL